MRDHTETVARDTKKMTEVVETYYEDLYASETQASIFSRKNLKRKIININHKDMPQAKTTLYSN